MATPPDRSLPLLAVTPGESGVLGSRHCLTHPGIALDATVAVINLYAMPATNKAGA